MVLEFLGCGERGKEEGCLLADVGRRDGGISIKVVGVLGRGSEGCGGFLAR